MKRLTLLLITLALVASAPAGAQQIAHSQFFPVVARTAGVGGTQWLSDVTVVNLTDSQLVVGTQFVIADQAKHLRPDVSDPIHSRASRDTGHRGRHQRPVRL